MAAVVLLYFTPQAQQQYCNSGTRFSEIPIFTDSDIAFDSAVVYGKAYNFQGDSQTLILHVFSPKTSVDTFQKRPLIVLVHGGGFSGGSLKGLNTDCIEFAKRGFVAATIEYRLGWNRGTTTCNGDPVSQRQALYRGLQDEHAAIRFLAANAATYHIDTAWIFAGGNSAGAFASANMAFLKQQDIDSMYPDLKQTLGNINSSGNNLTNSFTLKGLFHNWGSVVNIEGITAANAIPLVGFAGDLDNISPIDSGYWAGCTNFIKMWGSRAIYNKLTALGVCAELTVKQGGGHGVWKDTPEQNLFRIQRATCFFKSLFCGNCSSNYYTDSIAANCSLTSSIAKQNTVRTNKVYPNPFTDKIEYRTEKENHCEFALYSTIGEIIWQGTHIEQQDFSALTPGSYFLQISNETEKETIKLIK
ncbi:MAG: carboxylesterase family protein [Chitinophagales bacterium]|nr:carboxylesterase family protein [Chitinophagales bacterium]